MSLTILISHPFCVMKAKLPGGATQDATHCHRPVKFTLCADASVATNPAITTTALSIILIALSP
jgi:hypothetical protein